MFDLTTALTNPKFSLQTKLEKICQVTANTIKGADRVSLWVFSPNYDQIEDLIFYYKEQRKFTRGGVLKRSDFNSYFDYILNNEIVNAPNARQDEVTQCFTESYFKPNNIMSLLDFIIHKDFEPIGVICCESVDHITQWTNDVIEMLRKIANASSMYFTLKN